MPASHELSIARVPPALQMRAIRRDARVHVRQLRAQKRVVQPLQRGLRRMEGGSYGHLAVDHLATKYLRRALHAEIAVAIPGANGAQRARLPDMENGLLPMVVRRIGQAIRTKRFAKNHGNCARLGAQQHRRAGDVFPLVVHRKALALVQEFGRNAALHPVGRAILPEMLASEGFQRPHAFPCAQRAGVILRFAPEQIERRDLAFAANHRVRPGEQRVRAVFILVFQREAQPWPAISSALIPTNPCGLRVPTGGYVDQKRILPGHEQRAHIVGEAVNPVAKFLVKWRAVKKEFPFFIIRPHRHKHVFAYGPAVERGRKKAQAADAQPARKRGRTIELRLKIGRRHFARGCYPLRLQKHLGMVHAIPPSPCVVRHPGALYIHIIANGAEKINGTVRRYTTILGSRAPRRLSHSLVMVFPASLRS